ncbi:unnamed protein product [Cochlearia groenlandica]
MLELFSISAEVNVFNEIISSCAFLEVLLLNIYFNSSSGTHFKIDNKNLKILFMSCNEIDNIELIATRLEFLSVEYTVCDSNNVVLEVPRLKFNRNYWISGGLFPHTSYNISFLVKEKEHMVALQDKHVTIYASLSVSVNLKNSLEVKLLRKILNVWIAEMIELEIVFNKNNNLLGEDEESTIGANPFPNTHFRVGIVWMYNFGRSSKEAFALASCFVKQKTVINKLMIETPPYPIKEKIKIEEAVAKLKELSKDNNELSIECFF